LATHGLVAARFGITPLKQAQVATKGSKKGKLLSNCGKKKAIAFSPVRKQKN
tara:strand:- start:11701 stop:11856 length:156 start_codon:yes stop_codon:yes gene_type:complete